MENILSNKYIVAFLWGYIVMGFFADLITGIIMRKVWDKTTEGYKEILRIKNGKEPADKDVPFWLNSKYRKPYHWAPKIIGFLERIFYTTAVIFNQFVLIGILLTFKAIGNWNDFSSIRVKEGIDEIEEGVTRIRANNFVIGTFITLLFGILGGLLFRLTLDSNFLLNIIENSYRVKIQL